MRCLDAVFGEEEREILVIIYDFLRIALLGVFLKSDFPLEKKPLTCLSLLPISVLLLSLYQYN